MMMMMLMMKMVIMMKMMKMMVMTVMEVMKKTKVIMRNTGNLLFTVSCALLNNSLSSRNLSPFLSYLRCLFSIS